VPHRGRVSFGAVSRTVHTAVSVASVKAVVLTRESPGRISPSVENGVLVTYTRDTARCIATETRAGKVTTYTRDGSPRVSGWATV
jgi:hypothetical protein